MESTLKPLGDKETWNVDYKTLKDVINRYQTLCPTLIDTGAAADKMFVTLLAIGERLGMPLLQFLGDTFMMDCVDTYFSDEQYRDEQQWVKNCQYLSKINHFYEFSAGLTSMWCACHFNFGASLTVRSGWFGRVRPRIPMRVPSTIVASLEQTTRYLSASVDLVHAICGRGRTSLDTYPFQFDVSMVFDKIKHTEPDDDDRKDENVDLVGNIHQRLTHNGIAFQASFGSASDSSVLIDAFSGFEGHLSKGSPRNSRFCAFIDCRDHADDAKQNEIIMFEPPNPCTRPPIDFSILSRVSRS